MRFTGFAIAAGLAATIFSGAHAQEAGGWQPGRLAVDVNWTGANADKYVEGEMIMTTQDEGPGMLFYCLEENLAAVVSLEPIDFHAAIADNEGRPRLSYVRMYENGDMVHATKWVYIPELRLIRARDHTSRAKLYNAVIAQNEIRLQWTGTDPVEFTPPPVDDVFRDFGAECGLGRNRDKGGD